MSDRLLFVPGERLQAAKLNTLGYVTQGWLQYSLTFPYEEPGPWVLPVAATRAGKIMGFDAYGSPTMYAPNTAVVAPILSTGSTTPRLVEDRFAEQRNVKDFGAVGDGVTDDTAAIQAATNAITSALGGTVFFPPGRYKTNAPVDVNKHCVRFLGSGRGQNNSIGSSIIGSGDHDIIRVGAVFYFNMHLIQLENPISPSPTVPSTQLRLTGSSIVTISDCGFRFFWNAIVIDGGNNFTLCNNHMQRCLADGVTDGHGLLITDASGSIVTVVRVSGLGCVGFNTTPNTYGVRIQGGGTMYFSQLSVTTWGYGITTEAGVATGDVPTFCKWHNVELELNSKGWSHKAGTRVTMVDTQVALTVNGPGYEFGPGNIGEVTMSATKAVNNNEHGYSFLGTGGNNSSIVMNGCMASGNGTAASGVYDGVNINGARNITINGGRFGGWGSNSTPSVSWQSVGVRVESTFSRNISIVGADLTGNVNGGFATVVTVAADRANLVGCLGANVGYQLPALTVAGLPSATANPYVLMFTTNESGGAQPVISDGTNWRRLTDRAVVS